MTNIIPGSTRETNSLIVQFADFCIYSLFWGTFYYLSYFINIPALVEDFFLIAGGSLSGIEVFFFIHCFIIWQCHEMLDREDPNSLPVADFDPDDSGPEINSDWFFLQDEPQYHLPTLRHSYFWETIFDPFFTFLFFYYFSQIIFFYTLFCFYGIEPFIGIIFSPFMIALPWTLAFNGTFLFASHLFPTLDDMYEDFGSETFEHGLLEDSETPDILLQQDFILPKKSHSSSKLFSKKYYNPIHQFSKHTLISLAFFHKITTIPVLVTLTHQIPEFRLVKKNIKTKKSNTFFYQISNKSKPNELIFIPFFSDFLIPSCHGPSKKLHKRIFSSWYTFFLHYDSIFVKNKWIIVPTYIKFHFPAKLRKFFLLYTKVFNRRSSITCRRSFFKQILVSPVLSKNFLQKKFKTIHTLFSKSSLIRIREKLLTYLPLSKQQEHLNYPKHHRFYAFFAPKFRTKLLLKSHSTTLQPKSRSRPLRMRFTYMQNFYQPYFSKHKHQLSALNLIYNSAYKKLHQLSYIYHKCFFSSQNIRTQSFFSLKRKLQILLSYKYLLRARFRRTDSAHQVNIFNINKKYQTYMFKFSVLQRNLLPLSLKTPSRFLNYKNNFTNQATLTFLTTKTPTFIIHKKKESQSSMKGKFIANLPPLIFAHQKTTSFFYILKTESVFFRSYYLKYFNFYDFMYKTSPPLIPNPSLINNFYTPNPGSLFFSKKDPIFLRLMQHNYILPIPFSLSKKPLLSKPSRYLKRLFLDSNLNNMVYSTSLGRFSVGLKINRFKPNQKGYWPLIHKPVILDATRYRHQKRILSELGHSILSLQKSNPLFNFMNVYGKHNIFNSPNSSPKIHELTLENSEKHDPTKENVELYDPTNENSKLYDPTNENLVRNNYTLENPDIHDSTIKNPELNNSIQKNIDLLISDSEPLTFKNNSLFFSDFYKVYHTGFISLHNHEFNILNLAYFHALNRNLKFKYRHTRLTNYHKFSPELQAANLQHMIHRGFFSDEVPLWFFYYRISQGIFYYKSQYYHKWEQRLSLINRKTQIRDLVSLIKDLRHDESLFRKILYHKFNKTLDRPFYHYHGRLFPDLSIPFIDDMSSLRLNYGTQVRNVVPLIKDTLVDYESSLHKIRYYNFNKTLTRQFHQYYSRRFPGLSNLFFEKKSSPSKIRYYNFNKILDRSVYHYRGGVFKKGFFTRFPGPSNAFYVDMINNEIVAINTTGFHNKDENSGTE